METVPKRRDVETTSEEISESVEVTEDTESEDRFSESTRRYAKTSAGIVGMFVFAFIPFFTVYGMIIISIIAEIYIADWTYSAFKGSGSTNTSSEENKSEKGTSNVDDERSKVVTTTSSKDQFIK